MIKEKSVLLWIHCHEEELDEKCRENIKVLVQAFQNSGKTVIHVVDKETENLSGIVLKKRGYSAFFATDLYFLLSRDLKADTIYLCGAYTDICVKQTAVDAHQNNFHFFVATDAVQGRSSEDQECALWNMRYLQRESNVTVKEIVEG